MIKVFKLAFTKAANIGVLLFFGFILTIPFNGKTQELVEKKPVKSYYNTPISELLKINSILTQHDNKLFGIDVSHYQGHIDWSNLACVDDTNHLAFVIIRSTFGINGKDVHFKKNWEQADSNKFIKGAYHYFRPDENSTQQANNFIANVELKAGDMPPILDIEKMTKTMSFGSFVWSLKNWLKIVETHYGVKPIIYTSDAFYKSYLKDYGFGDYHFWIANYNFIKNPKHEEWRFWQFTDKCSIPGIKGPVDLNVFNGHINDLNKILIK